MANYYSSDPKGNYYAQPGTGYAPPQYAQGQQPYGFQPPPNPYQAYPPQASYAPPSSYPPPPPSTFQASSGEKFSKNSKFKDVWATILFLIHLGGFGVGAYFGLTELLYQIRDPKSSLNKQGGNSSTSLTSQFTSDGLSRTLGITLGSSVGAAAVFSLIYYFCMQRFTGKMIHVTFILAVLIFAVFAAYMIYIRNYIGGILTGIFALIYAFMYFGMRSRIPFAKVMLRSVCSVTNKYPGMLAVAISGLILSIAYNALWFAVLMGLFFKFTAYGQTAYGGLYAVLIGLAFSLYWTTQVIYNTIHVSISGVFATYYFLGTSAAGGEVTVPVNHPVAASTKRALTTSFGSICFGSLIIAILQTIRFIIRSLANESLQDGNILAYFCLMCVGCCLQIIEDLVQYFNTYAFAQVAIYGKDFVNAAKDTWALVKSHGIDAIINDNLIGNVLFVGSMIAGLICGLIGYIYLLTTTPNATPGVYAIVIVGCVFIGLSEFGVLNTVVDSGVVTTFVCLAEDPAALARTKPELYYKIQEVYPSVVAGV
ncbi:putative choline transporter, neither null mutation nor overexpression affects choline transport [Nowakowskiella sp. JEL0407]|nr:putative choline transporter, neither null mutation nor overexpression affects choline transport [Nowakowskiella sp. JEL0407]